MPTRDDKLDELLDAYCKSVWRGFKSFQDAEAAIHAHVEARVAEAYRQGFENGRASQVLRVESPKPEPTQFIIAGGDSFPAVPVQATKSFASTNHGGESHD